MNNVVAELHCHWNRLANIGPDVSCHSAKGHLRLHFLTLMHAIVFQWDQKAPMLIP